MKHYKILPTILMIALTISINSCKKDDSSASPSTSGGNGSAPSPQVGNVDGALVSLETDVTTIAGGFPFTITTETGVATFFASTGNNSSFINAGTVSVNTFPLDKQSNNSYVKSATVGQTPASLNFSSQSSNWIVSGAGAVPAISYNHNSNFPSFTGIVPTSITRANGLTISLGSDVNDADSVIVFITKGSVSITRTFAGTAASAVISASTLSSLPVVTDNSALIEVIPYSIHLQSFGGKNYAFVKEQANVKSINIQ